ncbi:hypothetical protein OC834_007335 [Tilletia horrida]|nr:hypothetical protein OC834_007335 [Tilletia horrida]
MRFVLLSLLLSATACVSAETTGPYQIGNGFFAQSFTKNQAYAQGQTRSASSTTRLCSFTGAGINLPNAAVQVASVLDFPSRINVSVAVPYRAYGLKVDVPANVVKIFTDAGAKALGTNDTILNDKVILNLSGIKTTLSRTIKGRANGTITAIPEDNAITTVGLVGYGLGDTNVDALSRAAYSVGDTVSYSLGAFTFVLTGAGKQVNVKCPAPARPPTTGWSNVVSIVSGATSDRGTPLALVNTGPSGRAPANSTTTVSGKYPNCTFSGLGTYPMAISLAGFKNNALASASNPILFQQGQSNIFLSLGLAQFLQKSQPLAAKASVKLSTLNVTITNASPSTKNLLPSGGYTSSVYILPTASSSAAVPASLPGNAPTSTYAAASFNPTNIGKGTTAVLSYSVITGSINLFATNSTRIATVPFICDDATDPAAVLAYDIA